MRHAIVGALLICAGIWLFPAVRAEDVSLAGRTLRLMPSHASCAFDPLAKREADYIQSLADSVGDKGRVLAVWANCESMALYRRGETDRPIPFVMIAALHRMGEIVPLDQPRARFLDNIARAFQVMGNERIMERLDPDLRARIDKALRDLGDDMGTIALGDIHLLGVLGRDQSGLYVGLLENFERNGETVAAAGVAAYTEIKGLVVIVNFLDVYETPATFEHLQGEARKLTSQIIADNDDAGH